MVPGMNRVSTRPDVPMILVVDDTLDARELYAEYLRIAGLRAEVAEDGIEALAKASFLAQRERNRLSMEFASNGVSAQKFLQFDPENYEFSLATTLTKDGKSVSHAVVWQGGFGDQSITPDPAKRNAVYEVEGTFKRTSLRSIKETQDFTVASAGVEDQYFLAMFLSPESPIPVKIGKQEFTGADGKAVAELHLSARMPDSKPLRVYVGPKDRQWLSTAEPANPPPSTSSAASRSTP